MNTSCTLTKPFTGLFSNGDGGLELKISSWDLWEVTCG